MKHEVVEKVLRKISGIECFRPKDRLQEDLGFDSLDLVTLLVELEEACEIEFDESDMNPFDLATIADVMALIDKYQRR